jgi:hypothetical protein
MDGEVASTGAKQSSRGRGLPNTRTVSRPAAPVASLFVCDHTTNACESLSTYRILMANGNADLTDTRGIFFFSSCHRRRRTATLWRL